MESPYEVLTKLGQFRALHVDINDLYHDKFSQVGQKSSVFKFLAQRKLIEIMRPRQQNGFRITDL